MIAASLLLAMQVASGASAPAQTAGAPAIPRPPATADAPIDWDALAPVPLVRPARMTAEMNDFVSGEAGRAGCPVLHTVDGRTIVRLDVALLVAGGGVATRAIPRAIQCPTVEQYGAGLVISMARNNLRPTAAAAGPQWYRATLVFSWT